MNDVIKLLPDSVANQIAAGEVIQQPSSVIKELVENSVDAGATRVDVVIKDAGRTLIQIVDNGCGMTPTDARLAFERHSTSKIRKADDLFELTTMGFRGEALASIAAIAQLDVRTMPHDATIGTRLIINGSKVESQEPEVTAPGTNFMVRNIFFNVPARRKFMKKDSVEFANILHEFERLALVNPGIEMSLTHNDQLIYRLNKSNLKSRIGELFGHSIEDNLIAINLATDIIKITGFVGNPSSARKRGAYQYFFVNGRNMKHPYFRKAVLNCYEKLIPVDAQPNYFINFEVDPRSIDVNIHPTKNEIKFEDEQAIWQLLSATVKESLGRYNFAPTINFDNPSPIDIPPIDASTVKGVVNPAYVRPESGSGYNPFSHSTGGYSERNLERNRRNLLNWETAYGEIESFGSGTNGRITSSGEPKYVQIGKKYIVLSSQGGMLLVDQRRAHIKVLFEKYRNLASGNDFTSQNLLFPSVLVLESSKSLVLENILDVLEEAGFKIDPRDDEWEIRAVPSAIGDNDGREIIEKILTEIMNETATEGDSLARLREVISLSMASASAVNYGQTLSESEMDNIVSSLFALPDPKYDPKGRTVIADLALEEIEKLFR